MKTLIGLAILTWLGGAMYFGCGGLTSLELAQEKDRITKMVIDGKDTVSVIYDGREFQNVNAANAYREDKAYDDKYDLAVRIFPWLHLPYSFIGLLITSFAFGALGGTIGILREVALEGKNILEVKVFSKPLLGGGCGVIILSISYILPILIVTGETQVRSLSIVLVSLFGGVFTEKFFEWLSSTFGKIFKTSNT